MLGIDTLKFRLYEPETLVLAAKPQPLDVLEQKRARPRLLEHAHVCAKRACARIGQALGLAARPEARLREGLARRAADQQVSLARCKASYVEQFACRHVDDVAVDDWPVAVGTQCLDAARIDLKRNGGLKSGGLEAEVKAAGAGEQADCAKLRHAANSSHAITVSKAGRGPSTAGC